MPVYFYIIPIAVILLCVIITMPIMKKKAAKTNIEIKNFQSKNYSVQICSLAGSIVAINTVPAAQLGYGAGYYGLDEPTWLNVELIPAFTYANTTYTGSNPMLVAFEAKPNSTYEINFAPNKPKDGTVVTYVPVQDNKIIFKSTFYITVKDITDTQQAQYMRGIY